MSHAQHLFTRQQPPGQEEIDSLEDQAPTSILIWVDMVAHGAGKALGQSSVTTIPLDVMDEDIEESTRFYEEDNGELHIRSDFLVDDDEGRARCAWFHPEPAQHRAEKLRRAVFHPRGRHPRVPTAACVRAAPG